MAINKMEGLQIVQDSAQSSKSIVLLSNGDAENNAGDADMLEGSSHSRGRFDPTRKVMKNSPARDRGIRNSHSLPPVKPGIREIPFTRPDVAVQVARRALDSTSDLNCVLGKDGTLG